MLSLSIQTRQALSKLVLPLLMLGACAIILMGEVNPTAVRQVRLVAADIVAPTYSFFSFMREKEQKGVQFFSSLFKFEQENSRLQQENSQLRHWYEVALALSAENRDLKANLNWIPDHSLSFVTGRVIAETGGIYGQAALLSVDALHKVKVGNIVIDTLGLAGRITEIGERSARILLISDSASHIPVMLASSHAQAIMTGNNTNTPKLIYYSNDRLPKEGERVVTGNRVEGLPAGIPVGIVHYIQPKQPVVVPYADLAHLNIVRVFDYSGSAVEAPPVPGRVLPAQGKGLKPSVFLTPSDGHSRNAG